MSPIVSVGWFSALLSRKRNGTLRPLIFALAAAKVAIYDSKRNVLSQRWPCIVYRRLATPGQTPPAFTLLSNYSRERMDLSHRGRIPPAGEGVRLRRIEPHRQVERTLGRG